MKKILAIFALATVLTAGAFAKSSGSDFAIGFMDGALATAVDEGNDAISTTGLNIAGFKADATFGIKNGFGLQLDTTFAFPVGKGTYEEKNKDETDKYDTTVDDGFAMNLLFGPAYTFYFGEKMQLTLGLGFDILYNSSKITFEKPGLLGTTLKYSQTASGWDFGVGTTVDFAFLFNKKVGLKAGLTTAVTGGKKQDIKVNDNTTKTVDNDNCSVAIIPDISFIVRF